MSYNSPEVDRYLAHFGILGQKWGVRRYQNEDGSLTEEGRARYMKERFKDPDPKTEKEYRTTVERSADLKKNRWDAKVFKGRGHDYRAQMARAYGNDAIAEQILDMEIDKLDNAALAYESEREYNHLMKSHLEKYSSITIKEIRNASTKASAQVYENMRKKKGVKSNHKFSKPEKESIKYNLDQIMRNEEEQWRRMKYK